MPVEKEDDVTVTVLHKVAETVEQPDMIPVAEGSPVAEAQPESVEEGEKVGEVDGV